MPERLSLRLENLNEDPCGSSATRATDYLHGFAYLSNSQSLIMFSELLCESPKSLTTEAINVGPVEAEDKGRVLCRRGGGLSLLFSRPTFYPSFSKARQKEVRVFK